MASELRLPTHGDSRGILTVIDSVLPFDVKRVYYIYSCSREPRGGHRHKKNRQALVCIAGSCAVDWNDGRTTGISILDAPDKLLIVEPEDYHVMRNFSPNAVLLVLASEHFDADDYIDEGY